MKTTLLLFIFACCVFQAFGQYSRSVYSIESDARRHSSLYSSGGETTIISIRESDNNALRVTLIDIDEHGETDNYRVYENTSLNLETPFALSGVGANAAGEVTLCILNHNTTGSLDVNYITVDPVSGTFSNPLSINGQYKKAFSRTRQKGDSLVTYFSNYTTTGMSRIAKSLSNTGTSTEALVANTTFSGTLFNYGIACELLLNGSDEYMAYSNNIIKRNGPNNYIEANFSGVLNSPKLAINASGELFVLKLTGDYTLYDGNLNVTGSGSIAGLQTNFNSSAEIYSLPNGGFRLWKGDNAPAVIDISSSYAISNTQVTRGTPLDQVILDGKQYIVGYDLSHNSNINTDGIPFTNGPSSITIVLDDLSSEIPSFTEYNQEIQSDKIRFNTNHGGRSFTNDADATAGFSFLQNGKFRNLIYTSSSHLLGLTVNGSVVGNTNTYESPAANGPYTSVGNYSLELMDKYNRGYYVTAEMIETHIAEITSGNPSYEIPFGIKEWPAHGDASLGQAANLAAFIDLNGNNTYEPELGDYPAIYGDQCLLNIYHEHPNTPQNASTETHQYYFTFDCDTVEAIENTVFIRSHVFPRNQAIFDAYAGTFVDFDLGNFSDDYVGTNVELGMTYAYNGDNFDEDNAGNQGFNDTIPAIGMITLQGVRHDSDGMDNATTVSGAPTSNGIGFDDGVIDNEYFTMESSFFYSNGGGSSPVVQSQWYNVMQGLTINGFPKTYNGVDIRHDYFGSSDPIFYTSYGADHGNNNSEQVASNPAGDRRISSASGPTTFNISDTMVLINAFVVGVDTTNLSPLTSLDRLFEHGQTLRDFFAQNSDACGNTFDVYLADNQLSVPEEEVERIMAYPNPANQHIQFEGIAGAASLMIFDLNGRMVISQEGISNHQSVDLSHLDRAIYLIQINDDKGSQTIRIVKQ